MRNPLDLSWQLLNSSS